LAQVGLVSNNTKINQFINATADLTCNKYRFSKPDPSVYEYGHKHDDDDDGNDDDSSSDDDSDDDINSGDIKDKLKNQIDQMKNYKKKGYKRRRRQASVSNNNSVIGNFYKLNYNFSKHLGTRYNLSCTAKGIDDGSGYIKLCSACWAWRKLPSNYFPQYVNELICDDTDGECLSGKKRTNSFFIVTLVSNLENRGSRSKILIREHQGKASFFFKILGGMIP
jgi:hypothetical protein